MEAPIRVKEAVLGEIYKKIERPVGDVIKERVLYYDGWNAGNIQRGCVTVFSRSFNEEEQLNQTHIYSYHIRVYTNKIHVYHKKSIKQDPDLIIKYKP